MLEAVRKFRSGEIIISRASKDRNVYVVIQGKVRVSMYSSNGKVVSFRELGEGSTFGEISAIDGEPRSANVEAIEDCSIAVLTPQQFWTKLSEDRLFLERTMKHLAATIRSLSERLFELATLAIQSRVYAEVLRLAHQHGTGEGPVRIHPAPKHADIASRIGANREQVTKELSAMSRAGLIVKDGKGLVVPDIGRLKRLIENERAG